MICSEHIIRPLLSPQRPVRWSGPSWGRRSAHGRHLDERKLERVVGAGALGAGVFGMHREDAVLVSQHQVKDPPDHLGRAMGMIEWMNEFHLSSRQG